MTTTYQTETLNEEYDNGTMPESRDNLATAIVGHRIASAERKSWTRERWGYSETVSAFVITLDDGRQVRMHRMSDDDLDLPQDNRRSRLTVKSGDTPPVSEFDPDDVARVDDRIREFWIEFEDGRIVTDVETILHNGARTFHARARVWADALGKVTTTGHATRTEDDGPYTAQETAESVAISRALRFLGIEGKPS